MKQGFWTSSAVQVVNQGAYTVRTSHLHSNSNVKSSEIALKTGLKTRPKTQ